MHAAKLKKLLVHASTQGRSHFDPPPEQHEVISRFARIYAVPRPLTLLTLSTLILTPSTYIRCTAEDETRAGLFRGLWLSSTKKEKL